MKNLYNPADVQGIIDRINKLNAGSERQWGTMNAAQMLAHINVSLEMAMGKHLVKPVPFVVGLIGKMVKAKALSEKPFGRGSPTDKSFIFPADLDFDEQKNKVIRSLTDFQNGGPSKCTTNPHPFFGHFTPEQWALFQWKHFDHHLRQFGV